MCPIINIDVLKKNDFEKPICYAAEHKNIEVVFDSTSGGLFSALADIMYKDNGFVGGAIFNDDFSVRQYISDDKCDLLKLRSSKYLQSNCCLLYTSILILTVRIICLIFFVGIKNGRMKEVTGNISPLSVDLIIL